MLAYSSSVSIYHVADPTFSKIFWLSLKPAQLIIVFPNRRNPGDVTNKGIFEWVLCFDDFLISERHHVAKSYKCTNWILKQNIRIIRTPFAIGQSGHSECLLRRWKKKKRRKKHKTQNTKQNKTKCICCLQNGWWFFPQEVILCHWTLWVEDTLALRRGSPILCTAVLIVKAGL